MGSSSKATKDDKRSYIDIARESIKREDCESLKENIQKVEIKECEEDESAKKSFQQLTTMIIEDTHHQEGPLYPGTEVFSLAYVMLAIIMDIKL